MKKRIVESIIYMVHRVATVMPNWVTKGERYDKCFNY